MSKDWMFVVDNSICDVRTVGVLVRDGKILVQRERGGNEYALPGGHLEDSETFEDAVIREVKEEMNIDVKVIDYVGMNNDMNCEERFYHCEIVGGEIKFGGEELERCCDSNYYEIRWVDVDDIDEDMLRVLDLVRRVVGCND